MQGVEESMGSTPGREAPITPDEADELDAGDLLQGLGVVGLRRLRRVRRVVWWFVVVPGDQDLAMEAMN